MRVKTVVTGIALAGAVSCLVAMSPMASMPMTPRATSLTDIVLVADNTGLTTKDWDLQKRAYIQMLQDEDLVPRDGSVAVSLVQYASSGQSQSSVVSLPVTQLNNASLSVITKSISSAKLYAPQRPGTAPIATAIEEIRERGREGASTSLCATASAPWPKSATTEAAQGIKAAAISRVSVITSIRRSTPTSATVDFSSLATGTGVDLSARSLIQATTLIKGTCLMPVVRVRGIEVNQVIQNWANEIPLVQNKPTLVRVFIESVLFPTGRATGVLHGERGGVALSGSPLSPINAGGDIAIDRDVANATDRVDFDSSLNFRLPASWRSGDVTLRFEAATTSNCDLAPTGSDCDVDVSFEAAEEPAISYVSVPHEVGGTTFEPSSPDLVEQFYRTLDTYPIRMIDLGFEFLPSVGDDSALADVLEYMQVFWTWDAMLDDPVTWWMSDERWYGVLDGGGGGLGYRPGSVSAGFLSGTGDDEAYGYGRNRGPHELAHNFGIGHAINEVQNGLVEVETSDGDVYEVPAGWCNEEGNARSDPDYPYWEVMVDGRTLSTISPLGDPDTEVWGLAPRFDGVNEGLAVISPHQVTPLMSYCTVLNSSGSALYPSTQRRWTDVPTYQSLAEEFLGVDFDITERQEPPGVARKTTSGIAIRGVVSTDSSGNVQARLAPVLPVPTDTAPQGSGDWSIRVLDSKGASIASRAFEIPVLSNDPQESGGPDVHSNSAPFTVVLPAAVARQLAVIEVYGPPAEPGGVPVLRATVTKSAAAPTVRVNKVSVTDTSADVSWVASDSDSSRLSTSVFYRPDAQSPWKLVAVDVVGSSVSIASSALAGGRAGTFAVVTSDGINVARAQSTPVRIANHSPLLTLSRSEVVDLEGAASLEIDAFAFDIEDGQLSSRVTWRVGTQGRTYTGQTLSLAGDRVPEGTHTVIARVMDSGGTSATAKFTLRVDHLGGKGP